MTPGSAGCQASQMFPAREPAQLLHSCLRRRAEPSRAGGSLLPGLHFEMREQHAFVQARELVKAS